ncbi:MAG: hypothetical protein QNJ40_18105 [Xanthomonadales bacterium]|nr:hypothetical protein [Xanthomonadales bacterium]
MTRRMLSDAVYLILTNAHLYAKEIGQDFISEQTVEYSLEKDCPYLFWC